jgi:hypothetical protein
LLLFLGVLGMIREFLLSLAFLAFWFLHACFFLVKYGKRCFFFL